MPFSNQVASPYNRISPSLLLSAFETHMFYLISRTTLPQNPTIGKCTCFCTSEYRQVTKLINITLFYCFSIIHIRTNKYRRYSIGVWRITIIDVNQKPDFAKTFTAPGSLSFRLIVVLNPTQPSTDPIVRERYFVKSYYPQLVLLLKDRETSLWNDENCVRPSYHKSASYHG